ncbi:MAG: RiPP maturation radical SAM C-methyltransferase [Deltaproteobacteria bacterium]|nr:RiPP maturation radical SAM C-methyltransferase [Deltaproteobacteria bacterium]
MTVLLVSPPWRMPDEPSLAVATLGPVLARAGIASAELHGTSLFPRTGTDRQFLSSYAAHLFVPCLDARVTADDVARTVIGRLVADLDLQGLVIDEGEATLADFDLDEDLVAESIRADVERAAVCVARCVEVAAAPEHHVVLVSLTFETQLPAALAIARGLRRARPDARIAFGGPACFGDVGVALVEAFPELDAVALGEGEATVVPLVRALRGELALAEVPGIAFLATDGRVARTASAPLVADLDALPVPDYRGFLAAHAAGAWSDLAPKLFFETSRGCWWGEAAGLCTFCGLNAEGLAFRRKSPERATSEILTLWRDHPTVRRLQATDNILDPRYFKTALPRLAAAQAALATSDRPLRIFFELRASATRDQLVTLRAAGVDLVQPGIESLSDGVLALMNKGQTALGQVQHIKHAYEAGVDLAYNLIVKNPGERAADYDAMTALVPALVHLPPPSNVTPMWLERWSPYHADPGRFGITAVRPKPWYGELLPGVPEALLARVAYVFDYDHPMGADAALRAAQRRFVLAVGRWQAGWRPGLLEARAEGDGLVIVDRRPGREADVVLDPEAAALMRHLDRARPVDMVTSDFPGAAAQLEAWRARGWVIGSGERVLSVVPRRAP